MFDDLQDQHLHGLLNLQKLQGDLAKEKDEIFYQQNKCRFTATCPKRHTEITRLQKKM